MFTAKRFLASFFTPAPLAGVGLFIGTRFSAGAPSGAAAGRVDAAPGFKEFNVLMRNNRYEPSVLTVNLGDRIVVNLTNLDTVSHGVGIAKFNARVPGGHVRPGESARMSFVASSRDTVDAATCGGPDPTDKTDDHGEELIINVL